MKKSTVAGFPSQTESDKTKESKEFGLKVGLAIEHEWFNDSTGSRFQSNKNSFHLLRLYARGEQPVAKYKRELSANGDLSYVNLDWKNVPIIPKFVDMMVNGLSDRSFDLKAFSQDPGSIEKRTKYMKNILLEMNSVGYLDAVQGVFGYDARTINRDELPSDPEELEIKMQLEYKPTIEIAEEIAIENVFSKNNFDLTKYRVNYDLITIGIGAIKNGFNKVEGITAEYVDAASLVWSNTESPYFDDIYYVGEVKKVSTSELMKEFQHLTVDDIDEIKGMATSRADYHKGNTDSQADENLHDVLYFEYRTFKNEVYKIKKSKSGADVAIKKDDTFNPPEEDMKERGYEKVDRTIEVIYSGAKVIGGNFMLKWELAKNMIRPKADTTKVNMSYSIVAPRMYNGVIESMVSRMVGFGDMIQLNHLKLQQVLSKMVPDGVFLDADGLSDIDLGGGTFYNPQQALDMYLQTGSVIGRSLTYDGDFNHAKIPVQEISTSGGNNKIASIISVYNFYLQMMRDVTGLNEAVDGSKPDENALVGIQKMAAANSNTAIRHVLYASLFLTLKTAECISLRISDVLEYSPTKESFIKSLGSMSVSALEEVSDLHLHDFGIFLELMPDDEEKAVLENNIQMSLNQKEIYLEDAIDIREIKSLKLSNQLLKIRRKKKQNKDQELQKANIDAQAEANGRMQEQAATLEVQKQEALIGAQSKLEQLKHKHEIAKLDKQVEAKRVLMDHEFDLNMQLRGVDKSLENNKEKYKEDRKDDRTKIQATQASELIDQRQKGSGPKNFESSGLDVLGDLSLETYSPK